MKTKISSYNGKINTNFHNNKIPKKISKLIAKTGKSYYPQVEECKY